MTCNPKRWMWGLLPIAILSWIAILNEYEGIEADLRLRTEAALAARGLSQMASFDGRDGVVSGEVMDDAEAEKAVAAAREVWGVRMVEDRTRSVRNAENYIWSATLRGGALKLAGFAPNEAARKAIVGVARAAFPKIEIVDHMKLARGEPAQGAWLGGVSFALEQLSSLRRGVIYLNGPGLAVAGVAESPEGYKKLKSALHGSLPPGFKLASDAVVAPVVRPFRWEARISANQLVLLGYVPDEETRERIFQYAKTVMPWMTMADQADVAQGEPKDWARAVETGLDQLARLEDGGLIMHDSSLTLEGVTPDEASAESVRFDLKKAAPAKFTVSADVRAKRHPVTPVAPFVTVIGALNGHIEIGGYTPSEPLRAALLGAISARWPGRRVEDRSRVAVGAPEGWRDCLEAGLSALNRIGGVGRIELTDRRLEISGRTEDEAVAKALPSEVAGAIHGGCEALLRIDAVAPLEPQLTWRARRVDPGEIVLEGETPSEAVKADLARAASALFPGVRVIDKTTVAPAPSRDWLGVAMAGLTQLARLRHGVAALSHGELTLHGEAPDAATVVAIREALARDVGRRFSAREVIVVKSEDEAIKAERKRADAAEADAAEAETRRAAEETERKRAEAAEAETRRAAEEIERERAEAAGAEKRRAAEEAARKQAEAAKEREKKIAEEKSPSDGAAKDGAPPSDSGRPNWPKMAVNTTDFHAGPLECREILEKLSREDAIRFQRSSAALDPSSRPTLDRLAKVATLCPGVRVEIKGHTDSEGEAGHNLALSRRRAEAVVSWLAGAGVDTSRIRAVGYGATRPVAANDTADNRAKNRRIDFSVETN